MAVVDFDDVITFTRSTGGSITNSQGQYEWLPANTPRIDYDPVTGECRGLLIEEQRTNLIPSSDTSAGSWVGGGDRVLGAATGLPGVFAVGASLVRDASTNTFNYYQSLAPVAGTPYTFSVFVRFEDGRDVDAEFGRPDTENTALNPFTFVVNGVAFTWSAITKEHVGGGLWRLSHAVTPSDTIIRGWGILIRREHKAGLPRLFVTGYQLEVGAFPTSLIHTEGSQVTRAADVASVNELSPWYNPEAGTLFVELAQVDRNATSRSYVGLYGSSSERMSIFAPGTVSQSLLSGYRVPGTPDRTLYPGVPQTPIGTAFKMALAYDSDTLSLSHSGSAPTVLHQSGTNAAGYTRLAIMNRGDGLELKTGHIRSIRYYPRKLSDAELQALTA